MKTRYIKENGIIYLEEVSEFYGVLSIVRYKVGTYDETEELKKELKDEVVKKKKKKQSIKGYNGV